MELREKMIALIINGRGTTPADKTADAILALPEIRDALTMQETGRSLTKAAMGKGHYELRNGFSVWVRDEDA